MRKHIIIPLILLCSLTACFFSNQPDYVGAFQNDVAIAKNMGKWGLVNKDMEVIVPFEYDSILQPSCGMTAVYKDGWGYLDQNYKLVLPHSYFSAYPFFNDCAIVSTWPADGFYLINKKGEKISETFLQPNENRCFFVVERMSDSLNTNQKFGLIFKKINEKPLANWHQYAFLTGADSVAILGDSAGLYLISSKNQQIAGPFEDFQFTNDSALITTQINKQWSLMNLNGKILSEKYDQMGSVTLDTAYTKRGSFMQDLVLGVITLGIYTVFHKDKYDEDVIKDYTFFADQLLQVEKNRKIGYINKSGILVIPLEYNDGQAFVQGCALVKQNTGWGAINKHNQQLIPFEYQSMYSNGDKLMIAAKNRKFGVFNNTGKSVIPVEYPWIDFLSSHGFSVYNKEKYAYYDSTGTKNTGFTYDKINDFSENRAAVCKNNRYGFINKQAKEIIPCTFEFANSFAYGRACVKHNGLYGYIDYSGKIVIPCVYETASDFEIDIARVMKKGQSMTINRNGEIQ